MPACHHDSRILAPAGRVRKSAPAFAALPLANGQVQPRCGAQRSNVGLNPLLGDGHTRAADSSDSNEAAHVPDRPRGRRLVYCASSYALSSAATSSFTIVIIASITACTFFGFLSAMSSMKRLGTICQVTPN